MRRARVIPVLLIHDRKLVKTEKFRSERYVGDPLNAVRIFNEKEVDEMVILDIGVSRTHDPDYAFLAQLLNECFMPLAYGGGVSNLGQAEKLFSLGVEKVVLGTSAIERPELVHMISNKYGAQSTVVCIDVKRHPLFGKQPYVRNGRSRVGKNPLQVAMEMENLGAGEIILQSVDLDGTGKGYDLALLKQIAEGTNIPVIALGGAGKFDDFSDAIETGKASAVAAGSFFIFQGPHRGVLISYPDTEEIESLPV